MAYQNEDNVLATLLPLLIDPTSSDGHPLAHALAVVLNAAMLQGWNQHSYHQPPH